MFFEIEISAAEKYFTAFFSYGQQNFAKGETNTEETTMEEKMMPELQAIEAPSLSQLPQNFTFWQKKVPEGERIRFLNPEDFRLDEQLKRLGIGDSPLRPSFCITDREEIQARQDLMRCLIERTDLRRWIIKSIGHPLPKTERDFLDYFYDKRDHNPHWTAVRELLSLLAQSEPLPVRLSQLQTHLQDSLALEPAEQQLGKAVSGLISQMAFIEGVAGVDVMVFRKAESGKSPAPIVYVFDRRSRCDYGKDADYRVWGKRQFSSALSHVAKKRYPEWMENKWNPLNWLGIGFIVKEMVDNQNQRAREKAMRSILIFAASQQMREDITEGVEQRLQQIKICPDSNLARLLDEIFLRKSADSFWLRIDLSFHYGQPGLKIVIGHITPMGEAGTNWKFLRDFHYEGRNIFTQQEWEKVEEVIQAVKAKDRERTLDRWGARLDQALIESDPDIFEQFLADSPRLDSEHRWFALTNLFQLPELEGVVKAAEQQRKNFDRCLGELKQVAELAEAMLAAAAKMKAPLCFPKMADEGEHIIDFAEIIPVQLFGDKKGVNSVVPIKQLCPINGQIIALTGFHGGGKTVTEEAIALAVCLAESGLPVFGRDFRWNIKRVLGAVFLERGAGSTCELLLRKNVEVLRGLQGFDGQDVLLILDELGTGTQESSGLELGRDFLEAVHRHGASVLVSTQILPLAQFAKEELGAACFQVNAAHQISAGIGDGGMSNLRQRLGFDKAVRDIRRGK